MADQTPPYDASKFYNLTKDWNNDPTAFLSLYYSLHFKVIDKSEDPLSSNVYVRQSPNKICVLGIVEPPKEYTTIVLSKSLIGEKVKADTVLVEFKNGETVVGHVKAQMDGKLLELNDRLEEEDLLHSNAMDTGFIAVIMPRSEETSVQLEGYVTKEEYEKLA
jgi:glycine cleavage system H lipoate-binding protein